MYILQTLCSTRIQNIMVWI